MLFEETCPLITCYVRKASLPHLLNDPDQVFEDLSPAAAVGDDGRRQVAQDVWTCCLDCIQVSGQKKDVHFINSSYLQYMCPDQCF